MFTFAEKNITMSNINLLIVEDEQRLADILKKQLEEAGFNADDTPDGYVGNSLLNKRIIILSFSI